MQDIELIRCEVNSIERCSADYAGGQCRFQRVPRTLYCQLHSGMADATSVQRRDKSMYRLGVWDKRVQELSAENRIKSLEEEIGICRMTLEEVLRSCHEPYDIIIKIPEIGDIVSRIEKLVTSQVKIQEKSGLTMDKSAIMNFVDQIIAILQKHITDRDVLAVVATEIGDALLLSGRLSIE